MHRPTLIATTTFALALVALGGGGVAAEHDGASPPGADTVKETTEVHGRVPDDLLGRWLTVNQVKLPNGMVKPFARLWEVRRGAEHPEMVLRRVQMPDEVHEKMQDAAAAGEAWTPTPEDVHAVAESWDQLKETEAKYTRIENKIYSADAYTPELNQDETTKGSDVALSTKESFTGTQVLNTYTVWAVRQRTPEGFTGTFVTNTMAAAPMPIPIVLKGDVQAYRLSGPAPAPVRSLSERLLDLFAGCRR